MKKCSNCDKTKPLKDFNNNPYSQDKLSQWCKECIGMRVDLKEIKKKKTSFSSDYGALL